jgi:hypothetical protein
VYAQADSLCDCRVQEIFRNPVYKLDMKGGGRHDGSDLGTEKGNIITTAAASTSPDASPDDALVELME